MKTKTINILGLALIAVIAIPLSSIAASTISGNSVSADGDLIINGNSTLGNSSADTLTVNATPTFAENVTFDSANITTGTNQTLTVAPNGTGDAAFSLDNDSNIQFTLSGNGGGSSVNFLTGSYPSVVTLAPSTALTGLSLDLSTNVTADGGGNSMTGVLLTIPNGGSGTTTGMSVSGVADQGILFNSVTSDIITGSNDALSITTGNSTSANSGAITIASGTTTTSGTTGAVTIRSGNSAGVAGTVTISVGTTGGNNAGAGLTLSSGAGGSGGGAGGSVNITGGDAQSGNNNGGNVLISAGNAFGTGIDGSVLIGGSNTATITLSDSVAGTNQGVQLLGRVVTKKPDSHVDCNNANLTLTVRNVFDSGVVICNPTTTRTITTPTAALLVAGLPVTASAGDFFSFIIVNQNGSNTLTLAGGSGVTIARSTTIPESVTCEIFCRVTNAAGGSEGITCY